MTDLAGLELRRKVAEALGFKNVRIAPHSYPDKDGCWDTVIGCTDDAEDDGDWEHIPHYESFPGAAFEALNEFCKKRKLYAAPTLFGTFGDDDENGYTCSIMPRFPNDDNWCIYEHDDRDPATAICCAIIEAHHRLFETDLVRRVDSFRKRVEEEQTDAPPSNKED